jgi:hypothetical protein
MVTGDLVAYSHNTLNRWKDCFFQLLNVHVSDVRQIEIHKAEQLLSGSGRLEIEIPFAKLKKV